ncbi:MAG: hypothetical protein ACRD3F_00725, partial [Acidobacteriaceae bacterium]
FYYHQSPERAGRIFVGLLGVGRKHTPAVTKALSIFYHEIQRARELLQSNRAAADAAYGTVRLTDQELKDLLFLYELALTYVLTRKGSDQVAEAIESRVRRDLQDSSPQHGELLIEMYQYRPQHQNSRSGHHQHHRPRRGRGQVSSCPSAH